MKSDLKGMHVLIVLGIGQNLLADTIADRVLSEYDTHLIQVHDREHDQIHICVYKEDVNLNQKNKQHANDIKHFCNGMKSFVHAFNA